MSGDAAAEFVGDAEQRFRARTRALVLVGSAHEHGKSAALGQAVASALEERDVETAFHHLAIAPVGPCTNCGACQVTGRCHIEGDSWPELSARMEGCDIMFLVAPVYFAGPAAPLKAALDRCQMFWARKYVLERDVPPKRPCHLLVVGDGGDPFGSEPLETICTSALNCANLRVGQNVYRFIGEDYDLSRVPQIVDAALHALKGLLEGAGER